MVIPANIWQTWKTKRVPDEWIDSPASIAAYCPAWDYTLTTDDDNRAFVAEHYPRYLYLYNSFDREICRADMVRYLLLHRYGGVYLDLDMALTTPLDDILAGSSLVLVSTPNWSGVTNAFMASAPDHPFWIDVVDEIEYRANNTPWYVMGDAKVLWTTGPGMLSSVARESVYPYTTIPYRVGHPCSVCDHYFERPCPSDASVIRELRGSSWSSSASWFHALVCRWKLVVGVAVLLLVAVLVYKTLSG